MSGNDDDDLIALAKEITRYKNDGKYMECIQKMRQHECEVVTPHRRNIVLIAQASCGIELGDLTVAREAIERVDQNALTSTDKIYFDLVLVNLLEDSGDLAEALTLIERSLSGDAIYSEEHLDALYEMFARKGFVLANNEHFDAALEALDRSISTLTTSYLRPSILLYKAYCLQGLGRLHEAERIIQAALKEKDHSLSADMYYRLGAIYLQKRELANALEAFTNAELSVPEGRIQLSEIYMAMSSVYAAGDNPRRADEYLRKAQRVSIVQ